MNKQWPCLVCVLILLLGSGCARASQQDDSSGLQIQLTAIPYPPIVGESRLVVQIADKSGTPIDDAHINIKGDMTHAGMAPILVEVDGGGVNGVYNIPFEWTMAGDWVLTAEVVLPDGKAAQERFDMEVLFEDEATCGEHEQGS